PPPVAAGEHPPPVPPADTLSRHYPVSHPRIRGGVRPGDAATGGQGYGPDADRLLRGADGAVLRLGVPAGRDRAADDLSHRGASPVPPDVPVGQIPGNFRHAVCEPSVSGIVLRRIDDAAFEAHRPE